MLDSFYLGSSSNIISFKKTDVLNKEKGKIVFHGRKNFKGEKSFTNYTFTIAIAKAEINYVLTIDNVTYPNHAIIEDRKSVV